MLKNLLLSCLAPGMPWAYRSNYPKAITINTLYWLAYLAFIILWIFTKFFPPIPLLILTIYLLIITIINAYNLARTDYLQKTRPTSMAPIIIVAILTFWLPMTYTFLLSSNAIIQKAWVTNNAMSPNIEKGDLILIDRTFYWFNAPKRGDLILIEEPSTPPRAYFARIIAQAGDSIQLRGSRPYVNATPLNQYYLKNQSKTNNFNTLSLTVEIPFHESFAKSNDLLSIPQQEPQNWYMLQTPNQALFIKSGTITLDPDTLFVLEDNRELTLSKHNEQYGRVIHKSWVKAKPLYVLYNINTNTPFRRFGTQLR